MQVWLHWEPSSCDPPGHDHEGEEVGGHRQTGNQECLSDVVDAGD